MPKSQLSNAGAEKPAAYATAVGEARMTVTDVQAFSRANTNGILLRLRYF